MNRKHASEFQGSDASINSPSDRLLNWVSSARGGMTIPEMKEVCGDNSYLLMTILEKLIREEKIEAMQVVLIQPGRPDEVERRYFLGKKFGN